MNNLRNVTSRWGICLFIAASTLTAIGANHLRKMTFAPHELHEGDAPPAIMWEPPALPSSINLESAEERKLRVVVMAKGLEQPWSLAFLPDGSMLITERAGRLRIVHDGKLASSPVAGVPEVQTGGPRGLQGLRPPDHAYAGLPKAHLDVVLIAHQLLHVKRRRVEEQLPRLTQ